MQTSRLAAIARDALAVLWGEMSDEQRRVYTTAWVEVRATDASLPPLVVAAAAAAGRSLDRDTPVCFEA